jgi:SAM-dependent methyltransferase
MSRVKSSQLRDDCRIFWQTLRAWGVVEAVTDFTRYVRARRQEKHDGFDERYGVETSRMVGLGALDGLGRHGADAVYYWPTREEEFELVMRSVGPLEYRDFVFIDIGCGKGRVVLLAAGLPFKRVIGLDFSPRLIEQAQRNIEQYSGPRRASSVDVRVGDAAEFSFPEGNLLLYMFDPFGPAVMEKMLANLEAARRQSSRQVTLLYYSPEYCELVQAAGFELLAEGCGENWPWHVYRARTR